MECLGGCLMCVDTQLVDNTGSSLNDPEGRMDEPAMERKATT